MVAKLRLSTYRKLVREDVDVDAEDESSVVDIVDGDDGWRTGSGIAVVGADSIE